MSQNTMSNVPKTIAVHQQKPEDVTFNIDRSRLFLEQCKRKVRIKEQPLRKVSKP